MTKDEKETLVRILFHQGYCNEIVIKDNIYDCSTCPFNNTIQCITDELKIKELHPLPKDEAIKRNKEIADYRYKNAIDLYKAEFNDVPKNLTSTNITLTYDNLKDLLEGKSIETKHTKIILEDIGYHQINRLLLPSGKNID